MPTFSTASQKYALDLNVELNHSTVKRLEKYTIHYQKTNKKIKIKKTPQKAYSNFFNLSSSPKVNCKLFMQDKIFLTLHCLSWSCLKAKSPAKLVQLF